VRTLRTAKLLRPEIPARLSQSSVGCHALPGENGVHVSGCSSVINCCCLSSSQSPRLSSVSLSPRLYLAQTTSGRFNHRTRSIIMRLSLLAFVSLTATAIAQVDPGPSPTESIGCEPHGDHWYLPPSASNPHQYRTSR
jgi:hypothetical protein